LRAWLGYDEEGNWTTTRAGLAVPRQNGKNAIIEIRELYGMIALGERILHTAHEVKTARKAFKRILSFFENTRKYPELAKLVLEIRKANGQEAIILKNGGSVEFAARSKSSGRGFSVDVLIMDEAQEFSDDAYEALLPTISASANPQQILTGTPPGPTQNGEVFARFRESALDGTCPIGTSWIEWSCTGRSVNLNDRANWAATNPALGIRLSWDFTEGERASFSDEGFARERLGMWDGVASHEVIDMGLWADLLDPESRKGRKLAFALDVAPDRSMASIAVASMREDGLWHIEIIDRRKGAPTWVVDRLAELNTKWKPLGIAMDAAGPAGSLLSDLTAKGITPTVVNAREVGQACGAFYDAAMEGRLRHRGQDELTTALAGAKQRVLGDAWAWHRKDSATDITPLVAVTLAMSEYVRQENAPKRSGKVWGSYGSW